MIHVQTGNMLDVVVEGKSIGLKQRDSDHRKYEIIWLPAPEGLRDVLSAEIKRLNPIASPTADEAERQAREIELALARKVVQRAAQFCEEVSEDIENVPQIQLKWLNEALDAYEGLPPSEVYDDSQLALAGLSHLASDVHATDNQRRIATLAISALRAAALRSRPVEQEDDLQFSLNLNRLIGGNYRALEERWQPAFDLVRELRERPVGQCAWSYDPDGYWQTECGDQFCISEGTPAENRMVYCHHCGKKIDGNTNALPIA